MSMIATYVLGGLVVLLGGLLLIHRSRTVAALDALRDSVRDANSLAERARHDVRRLEKLAPGRSSGSTDR